MSLIVLFLFRALRLSFAFSRVILLILSRLYDNPEKRLRVQVLHRVPISRTRVRLSQVTGNRGEDQQDQMVQTTKFCTLSVINKWYTFVVHHFTFHPVLIPRPKTKPSNSGKFLKSLCEWYQNPIIMMVSGRCPHPLPRPT